MLKKRDTLFLFSIFSIIILIIFAAAASIYPQPSSLANEQYGYVIVSSSPTHMRVYIDGIYTKDKTPTDPIRITSNVTHIVGVSDKTQAIVVSPGETRNLFFNLTYTCSNECASGAKRCSGGIGYQTCGNYDTDSCLEWNTLTTPCASGQTCSGGICVSPNQTLPDLIVENITFSKNPADEGEVVTALITTKNIGAITAPASYTSVSVSSGTLPLYVYSLRPNESTTHLYGKVCGAADITFDVTADSSKIITETNENNNNLKNTLSCRPTQNQTCTDTDGGLNYFLKGTVTNSTGSMTDWCGTNNLLLETSCISPNSDELNGSVIDCSTLGNYVCQNGACVSTLNQTLPDLLISNLNVTKYYKLIGNSTIKRVLVSTTIKNTGNADAGSFNIFIEGLNFIRDSSYGFLAAGNFVTYTDDYECQYPHLYNVTLDRFNAVSETNENNNKASLFIDCIV
ncbi:MAG: CARDB domain-containing protein [Nanoarchaeota archaeon]